MTMWDAAKGVALQTLEGHLNPVSSVAWLAGDIAKGLFFSKRWVPNEKMEKLLWLPS
jgi:hypothetical protein